MATTEITTGAHSGGVVNCYTNVVTGDGNDTQIDLGFVARRTIVIIGANLYEIWSHYPKTGAAVHKVYKNRAADTTGDVAIVVQDSGKTALFIKVGVLANAATAFVQVLGN